MPESVEMTFEIPGVNGECKFTGLEGHMQIFSYSLGITNPSSAGFGGGSGAGKVAFQQLVLSKQLDLGTGPMFLKCCQGKHFDTAKLHVRESAGETPLEYLTIEMKQVFIDSMSWGGSSGGGKTSETVGISVAELKYTYWSQTETGDKGEKGEGGWNINTNSAVA